MLLAGISGASNFCDMQECGIFDVYINMIVPE